MKWRSKTRGERIGPQFLAFAALAMAVVSCKLAAAEGWPVARGDTLGSGVANTTLPDELEVLWTYAAGNDAGFDATALRRHAQRSNQEPIPRPLSIYVHVPFCFSPCFYCGCNRIITRDFGRSAPYLLRLAREIELVAPWYARDRDVLQVPLGGGTPNFLRPDQVYELMESLRRNFHLTNLPERDFSIELDPRLLQTGDIASYAAIGFTLFGVAFWFPTYFEREYGASTQTAMRRDPNSRSILRPSTTRSIQL